MRGNPSKGDRTEWASLGLDEIERRLGAPVASQGEQGDVWPPDGAGSGDLIADAAFFSFTAPETVHGLDLPQEIRVDLLRAAALPGEAGLSSWHRIAGRVRLDACDGSLRRLLPPLYANLSDHIEAWRLTGAKAMAVEAWCQGLRLQQAARGTLDALRDAGIEFLPVGGTALVARYHGGDWSRRWTSRIRLLIRPPGRAAAETVLARDGWDPVHDGGGGPAGHRQFEKKGIKFDLHTGLVGGAGGGTADQMIWHAAIPAEGLFARALCPTDHLLYACTRADPAGASLSWAIDAMTILQSPEADIDWGRLQSMAAAAGARDVLRHALLFLRTHLDAAVPNSAIPAPAPRPAVMLPSSIRELLLRAATLHGEPAVEAWRGLQSSRVDRGAVEQLVGRLVPMVYANLRNSQVPRQELAAAEPAYIGAWTQNQRLLAGTRSALEALRAARIDFLLLKGAALIPLYFRDWGARWMTDIDVWVRSADLPTAVDILRQEGWDAIYPPRKLAGVSRVLHSCAFRKPGTGELDLHWHLLLPCCWEESDDEFWEASVPVAVGPVETQTLCPTDQLFHVCAHAEASRVYNDEDTEQWVVDAMAILNGAGDRIDWTRLVALANDRQLGRALGSRLVYLRHALGAAIPPHVSESLASLPLSAAERIEHASLRQQSPRVRRLLNLMSQFLRLRRQRRFRSLPAGPIRFLRDYWHLDPASPLGPTLVRKAVTNLRSLLPGDNASRSAGGEQRDR